MKSGGARRMHYSGELVPGRSYRLAPQQAHHAARVLRLKSGEALTLFNGDGAEYPASVERFEDGAFQVRVLAREDVERESRLQIVLGQALSSGERMDFTVQKSVELGVSAIHPLAAARSVVRLDSERARRRVAHWQAVAVAACEQCGRNRVPAVEPVSALDAWLERHSGSTGALRLLCSPGARSGLRELPAPQGGVMLLAGPEGGFTEAERAAARGAGFVDVRLGPRTLRTETAALAALAAMQALWGDF
jgi:16S rRNA (uracil1498-N3)-methyltransferase